MCVCVCVYVCVCACVRTRTQLCLTLCHPTDCNPSLSMEFSRQGYWSGLPFPPPGDLPNPGIEPMSLGSPALAGGFFTRSLMYKSLILMNSYYIYFCCFCLYFRYHIQQIIAKSNVMDICPGMWAVVPKAAC